MRGFVQGIVWGGLAAVGGLVVVSQVAGPVAPLPDSASVTPEPTSAPKAALEPAPAPEPAPEPAAEPAPAAPTPAPQPAPPEAQTNAPAAQEAPAASGPAPTLPASGEQATDAPSDAPAAPAPALPTADGAASVPQAPAEPPVPPASTPPADPLASAGRIDPVTPPAVRAAPEPATPPAALDVPAAEPAPGEADLPPPPPLTPQEEALLRPLPQVLPPEAAQPAPQSLPDPTPEPSPTPEPAPVAEPMAPATLPPAPGLSDQASGVVTGRLPRIGTEGAPALADTTEPAIVPEADLPPRLRFARPFDNAAQKPLFAILLIDTGAADVNRAELAALDLPLSIVIDPLSDGAAERAAQWRAGGQEVLMAASGIPAGAAPADLEQSLQILSARLPEAVALIDSDGAGFQNDRPLSSQMVPILADQGRGLVTFDQGLNAADQEARRNDLPATTIFRRIDADAEDAPVIRRYLDRAAFKAAQDGRVVVIGTLRPETVTGILEWAVEGRASTVALAPITALLQTQ